MTHLENLNRQIRIGDVLHVLIAQSNKLMDMVNANQKEVIRLEKELKQLKTQNYDQHWTSKQKTDP